METVRAVAYFNDTRRKGKDDPKWRGRVTLAGQVYYIDAWEKPDQPGIPDLLSIRFKSRKEE